MPLNAVNGPTEYDHWKVGGVDVLDGLYGFERCCWILKKMQITVAQ